MDILQTKRTNNEIKLENEKVHCKIAWESNTDKEEESE